MLGSTIWLACSLSMAMRFQPVIFPQEKSHICPHPSLCMIAIIYHYLHKKIQSFLPTSTILFAILWIIITSLIPKYQSCLPTSTLPTLLVRTSPLSPLRRLEMPKVPSKLRYIAKNIPFLANMMASHNIILSTQSCILWRWAGGWRSRCRRRGWASLGERAMALRPDSR